MLIKCTECGEEISDKSEKCIHCGYPIGKHDNRHTVYQLNKLSNHSVFY